MSFQQRRIIPVKAISGAYQVRPVQAIRQKNEYKLLGGHIIPHKNAAIHLAGGPGSGKTTVIDNIIEQCSGPLTCVIIFSNTLNSDDSWVSIINRLRAKGQPVIERTSIFEGHGKHKKNLIKEWMDDWKKLRAEQLEIREREDNPEIGISPEGMPMGGGWAQPPENKERQFLQTIDPFLVEKNGEEYEYVPFIFIFDDLSQELRDPHIAHFVKQIRHHRCKMIMSSQSWTDSMPGARENVRLWYIFRGFDRPILKKIREAIAFPNLSEEELERIYKDATRDPFSFLHVNGWQNKIMSNYSKIYDLDSLNASPST